MATIGHETPALMRVSTHTPPAVLSIHRNSPSDPMVFRIQMPQTLDNDNDQPAHTVSCELIGNDLSTVFDWMHSVSKGDGLLTTINLYVDGFSNRLVQIARDANPRSWSALDINRKIKISLIFDISPLCHPRLTVKYLPEVGPEEIETTFYLDDPRPPLYRDLWDNIRYNDTTLIRKRLIDFIKMYGSSLKKVLA